MRGEIKGDWFGNQGYREGRGVFLAGDGSIGGLTRQGGRRFVLD